MLHWAEDYFVGKGIKDPDAVRKKLDQQKLAVGIFLLTFSRNNQNLMELLPASMLKQRANYERCPEIFGMAKGKDGAIDLMTEILVTCYQKNGNYNLKEYLRNR